MSLEDEKNKFLALNDWFQSTQGKHVSQAMTKELKPLKELLYGDNLLQLNDCGSNPWLKTLRYKHKWLLTPSASQESDCISDFMHLPLESNSVDCILAPFTMHAFTHKRNPIDELDRILKPMGYIVFFGINPFSFWGMLMPLKRASFFKTLRSHSMSIFFMKRMMLHRGYTACHLSHFYFIPPVSSEKTIKRFEFMNKIGKMIGPFPAGFYCLVMQKFETAPLHLFPETITGELALRSSYFFLPTDNASHQEHKCVFSEITFNKDQSK